MSDHQAVVAEFTLGLKYNKKKPRRVFLFKKGNIQAIKDKLKELITSLDFNTRTVNENWEFLRDSIMEAIKTHIPSKKVQDGKHVPWLNVKIKRSIRKRKRLYNKAKKSGERHRTGQPLGNFAILSDVTWIRHKMTTSRES